MGLVGRIVLLGMMCAAWLAAALPAFAVEATLVADAHVNAALPGNNSGSISNLNVGGGYTALLQFDLSALPMGTTAAQVSRAMLRLYCNRMDTAGVVSVQPVGGAWGEYSVTYATLPSLGSAVQTAQVSQAGAYVVVDVTALVQGWVSGSAANEGVALTSGGAVVQFDSKENDLTGHAAELDVVLASMGPVGPAGQAGLQGQVGPAGPQGATGPIGPVGPAGSSGGAGLRFQGAYVPTLSYALDDIVTFQGSSYVSLIAANHGVAPANSTQWGLLAAAGVGTTGPQGLTGAPGLMGPQGLTGPQGVIGPAGSAGAAGPQGAPGLVYRGGYLAGTSYALGDVVLWQGASYASLAGGNRGNTPSGSPAQWGVLTAQGPTGAVGAPGPQGIPGSAGPQGAVGPMGAQGVAGPVGMTFRGAYSATVSYAVGDGVLFGGGGYVSLVAGNLGILPGSDSGRWAMFATGTVGPAGATGAMGPQGLVGPQGLQGVAGPQGPQGATGAQGPPVANYTGNYVATTNYALHDAVSLGGSTYISLVAGNDGNTPSLSPVQWALLAAQGVAGPAGAAGPAGTIGATGPAGAVGAVGPQGPPVSFLGEWLVGTSYGVGSAVFYGGSSYVAIVANVGREPDLSPSVWALLAQGGMAGSPGAAGAAGPPGLAGAVGVNYRGAWATGVIYQVNDAVLFGGTTYLARSGGSGAEPDLSPAIWAVLAQEGAAGATGPGGGLLPR
jgi:hypothetical protein